MVMTPQQVILKRLQQLLPEIQKATDLFVEVEEIIQLSIQVDSVEPIDSILAEEYQTFNDQTKRAEWVAESLAELTRQLERQK
jgi:hypothetical protein